MRTVTVFIIVLVAAAIVAAEGDVHPIPLVLHPAAAPAPALKYPLLPELRDTIPGNAVTHYRRAVKNLMKDVRPEDDWFADIEEWLTVPLKEFPRADVGKYLKKCVTTFREVEAGARSEQCDWGLTKELRKKGSAVLDSEVLSCDDAGMYAIVTLLSLRTRFEVAEGQPGKAARTLQTGFAAARSLAEKPRLDSALVGTACTSLMETRLEEFIQQPNAPSLYWSLTDLPRPFIDLRKALQGERVGVYGTFPGMAEAAADLNAKPFTPEQVEKALQFLGDQNSDLLRATTKERLALDLAPQHEAAKKILIDQGRPKELVDAMPDFQVGLLVGLRYYDQILDEYLKLETLPYNEGRLRIEEATKRVNELVEGKDAPVIPLPNLFLLGVTHIYPFRACIDRRIAALRCVEAVRLYAAGHDGKLPPSLEEIKDVPVPLDPVTGRAFDYHVVGDRAILRCMSFPGLTANNDNHLTENDITPTYELMMKK
ncbi:MAG TPA: hypothetical protein DDY78_12205 [Planctomycetales bacterium]|jgi:hypothetical protein|nr:hypothetical protein [Planctomycetales bacterium]